MRTTFVKLAVVCSLASPVGCVSDDTVQESEDAGYYPSDASPVNATLPNDFGEDASEDAADGGGVTSDSAAPGDAGAKGDAGDASVDASEASVDASAADASDATADSSDASAADAGDGSLDAGDAAD